MARIEPLYVPHYDVRSKISGPTEEEKIEHLQKFLVLVCQQINQNYTGQGRAINLSDTQNTTKMRSWMGL